MASEDQKRLMHRAGTLLGRRSYSCGELRLRLLGIATEPDVEAVLSRLVEVNLLNDGEYAYNYAFDRVRRQGWGPIKVRHSLLRRHVAPPLVESAIERVQHEISEEFVLDRYLDRYCGKGGTPTDRKSIRKLLSHLRRRGFHDEAIRDVLMRKIPAAAWRYFDTGE